MVDIERLENDSEYWDEVAGTASHYCPENKQFYDSRLHPCCIPRPKPQPADEWVDGFPEVGVECDYVVGNDRYPVTVVGHYDDEVVVFQHESEPDYVGVQAGYLRPRPTTAERQRQELRQLVSLAVLDCRQAESHKLMDAITDAILSKYNLVEK